MVEVDLSRIIINERSEEQVIVLKEKKGERAFPILIGIYEATAIDRGIKEYRTPRPLTHDLLCSILRSLDVEVERIVISDLRNRTFYAKLVLMQTIAIAVQAGARIFVEEKVLEEVLKNQQDEGTATVDEVDDL